jgi:5-methyltetrahydropteroyltriglutamate--homocysteine methyltransferase
MALETTVIGSFPERGNSREEKIKNAVDAQTDCGVKLISDGQPYSMTIPVAKAISGFKLLDETGKYKIAGRIDPKHVDASELKSYFDLLKKYCTIKNRQGINVKPVFMMAGPLTMATTEIDIGIYGEDNKTTTRNENLYMDIARAQVRLINLIDPDNEAAAYHIDEPQLSQPSPFDAVKPALEYLASSIKASYKKITVNLHVCGNVTKIFPKLLELENIDVLSHGFTGDEEKNNMDLIKTDCSAHNKQLGLGCINTASEEVENLDDVVDLITRAVKYQKNDPVIHPDCGLRALPYNVACDKLKVMCAAAEMF